MRLRLASALARHLVRVMPHARADWAMGMKAEIETIDDPGTALAFALGCVRVSYGRRMRTVRGAVTAIRWLLATVTVLFSTIVFANAWLTQANEAGLSTILGGLGLAFLVAGLGLARFGPLALTNVAVAMLALNTVSLFATNQTSAPVGDFHRALIVEGYLLWSALLMAGLTLHWAARSPRLATFARDHGWDA